MRALILTGTFLSLLPAARAHCPLCTVGAAAAAGGATTLGLSQLGVGIFIGAFAVSIGLWIARVISRQYLRGQKWLLMIGSYLLTVPPMLYVMREVIPLYITLWGDYGGMLHTTYMVNAFLLGSLIGAGIVTIAPWLSTQITQLRAGRQIPFQGIALTFLILIIVTIIFEVIM